MWITMKARHKGWCRRCYKNIKKNELIEWHKEKHTVRHPECEKGTRLTLTGNVRKKV